MKHKELPSKKTKIVCTIGPASESEPYLEQLIAAGMNIARLNFAHGDFESHSRVISNIRAASSSTGTPVAIMGDLPGPKMRIGRIRNKTALLERNQPFSLYAEERIGDSSGASMSFAGLAEAVIPGDIICVRDGYIELKVEEIKDKQVLCRVLAGGEIRSYNGVNFPGVDLGIDAFTDRDREFLEFAAAQGLDAISQSFVQHASDITAVREAASSLDYHPFVIAKIERARAVDNLDRILAEADGIMVARGDLGVEIPIEEIAIVQKHIIEQVRLQGKPVITATQMLESMINHPRPTRAEATDVANAILDGTDCVMLSGETAMGRYPVEAVSVMSRIAQVTEPNIQPSDVAKVLEAAKSGDGSNRERLLSITLYLSVEVVAPVAVVAPTLSGDTARLLTRFRLPVWIIASSPNKSTCQQLLFSYGVYPVYSAKRPEVWERFARNLLVERGIDQGVALLTYGMGTLSEQTTTRIEFLDLAVNPIESPTWLPTK
ncbi:MAG TPA: pyruvate kinase [candidate division Zixibacteria bacterium]|nr:pyruvate kinase [candidate division Zixibacteria bacterium]